MLTNSSTSRSFYVYSVIVALVAATNAVNYWGGIFFFGYPHNIGVAVGTIATILLAVLTVEIARGFRRIEQRLQKLENIAAIRSGL